MGGHDPTGSWFQRIPTIAKGCAVALLVAGALAAGFTDIVDRLPPPLTALFVIGVGVGGLVIVGRKDWADEARREPAHLLLYLLRPLPLTAWRVVMTVMALGVVILGVGGLIGSLV